MQAASNWSGGYPVREAYPASWHGFLSPAHLKLVCAIRGVAWDVDAHRPMCIAEVGCGTGYSALMLAAGNPRAQVVGLDYNPAHIAEARAMAAAAGLRNLQFLEADVGDLARPGSALLQRLPEFDLVTAHGLWSWVADEVRQGLLALLQARLKPGGLALVSYNALPGAAAALGLARLVRQALDTHADTADGLAAAGSLVQRLVAAQAAHLPPSAWRGMLTGGLPAEQANARQGYLLHEFSTRHWRPSFHADVAAALASVRCDYVGSASLDENFPQLSLSAAQRALWDEAPDTLARELVFDLCVPRPFRRDVFVRGLRRVPAQAAVDALRFVGVGAAPPAGAQPEALLQTQQGQARLPAAVLAQVQAALAQGPKRIGELRRLPGCEQLTAGELAAVLAGSASALPLWWAPGDAACPDADSAQALAAARRLNAVVAERWVRFGVDDAHFGIATPLLGGGLQASALELAVLQRLLTWPAGDTPSPGDIALALLPQGEGLPAQALQGLTASVQHVLQQRAATWARLGVLGELGGDA